MSFLDKLTKSERKHMRLANCHSLAAFKRTAAYHAQLRRVKPYVEPCFECKAIARKLGLEV